MLMWHKLSFLIGHFEFELNIIAHYPALTQLGFYPRLSNLVSRNLKRFCRFIGAFFNWRKMCPSPLGITAAH